MFERCVRIDQNKLDTAGIIWRVDKQTRYPFRASLLVVDGQLADVTVEIGGEVSGDRPTRDVQWLFVFARIARCVDGQCAWSARSVVGVGPTARGTREGFDVDSVAFDDVVITAF